MFVINPEQLIGRQFGNYQIEKFLKGGGFGWVYQAKDVKLQRKVAIKFLKPELALSKEAVADFEREAKIIANFDHPEPEHILGIYEYSEGLLGIPSYVMSFIERGSLRRLHPHHSIVETATILSYVKQIAHALQYAHNHRFIHRDVKPENVLYSGPDRLLLSDFGIAIPAHSIDSLTPQNSYGTLFYMAPEQYEHRAQIWSDQYALAVVAYEWFCGELPFDGKTPYELYLKHKEEPPSSFEQQGVDVPRAVERVIMKALAKNPQQRYASVLDFATALEQAGKGSVTKHAPPFPGTPPSRRVVYPTPEEYDEAIRACKEVLLMNPKDDSAYINLALAFNMLGYKENNKEKKMSAT